MCKEKISDSFKVVEGQMIKVITWDENGEEIEGQMYLDDLLKPFDVLAKYPFEGSENGKD